MKNKTVTEVSNVAEVGVCGAENVLLAVKSDLTQTETDSMCTVCKKYKPQTTENFSILKNGKFRRMCKECQTKASLAWSAKRSDYRRQYHLAVMYQNAGIPAILPTAKEWKQGDPIMTVAYTDSSGVYHPSVNATQLYAEIKKQRKAERQKLKLERERLKREIAERRRAERNASIAEREKNKLLNKMQKAAEREMRRKNSEQGRLRKAEELQAEKDRQYALRIKEKEAEALLKAERARAMREQRILAKAEARRLKILSQAERVVLYAKSAA